MVVDAVDALKCGGRVVPVWSSVLTTIAEAKAA